MARFHRQPDPGPLADYRSYRQNLRVDFRYQCAYCNVTEGYRKGSDAFEIDHFRPRSKFPLLGADYSNLYYACGSCNRFKNDVWPDAATESDLLVFVDPCHVDPFERDLIEQSDGMLVAGSRSGAYTLEVLKLNRPNCLNFRRRRLSLAEKIRRYRSDLAEIETPELSVRLVVLNDLSAEWEECFGPSPAWPGTVRDHRSQG